MTFISVRGFLSSVVVVATTVSCQGGGDSGATNPPNTNTPAPVATVTVTSPASVVFVGNTLAMTATPRDAGGAALAGRTILWASSDNSKASVSSEGIATGIAAGSTTITATTEGKSGSLAITVALIPVATITVTPTSPVIFAGTVQQLSATTLSAAGPILTGRTVSWISSNTSVATVSSLGLVRGVAAGTATVSATSEAITSTVIVTVNTLPPGLIVSGLHDPVDFAAHCPADDPAFAVIRNDFVLLSDGVPSTATIACTDPYSTTSPMSDELMEWQALRLVYAMSPGTAGKLPWTTLSLYDWLKAQVSGIDIKTAAGNSACCETINGKRYFFTSRHDAATLNFYHDWIGLSAWVGLILHESRHVLGPGHVTGCPAFPLPTDPAGCDANYDLQNLGSYGVQYWFFSSLANGTFNVGIGCLPAATAQQYATSAALSANAYPSRFVTNAPPSVTATAPYGGLCLSQ